jgi:hypothetical protein
VLREDTRRVNERLKRFILGDRQRISGTVYGTIIVMSILAAGARPYQHQLWRLLAIVAVTVLVLWLAHVYAHGLGESLQLGRRLTLAELRSIARREYSIVAAAALPVISLALGVAGVLPHRTAVLLALWLGVVALTTQGVRYAQLERLNRSATVATIALNLAIGLGLVAIEAWISH